MRIEQDHITSVVNHVENLLRLPHRVLINALSVVIYEQPVVIDKFPEEEPSIFTRLRERAAQKIRR